MQNLMACNRVVSCGLAAQRPAVEDLRALAEGGMLETDLPNAQTDRDVGNLLFSVRSFSIVFHPIIFDRFEKHI